MDIIYTYIFSLTLLTKEIIVSSILWLNVLCMMQRYCLKLFFPALVVRIFLPSLINLFWCVSSFEKSCSIFENYCFLLVFPAPKVIFSFFYTAWKHLTCKHSLSHSHSSWCIYFGGKKKGRINDSNVFNNIQKIFQNWPCMKEM